MARPRLPQAKAEASGAALKNPQRFRNRKTPTRTRPLGEPYVKMTDAEKAAWAELAGDMPWLHSAHRTLLQMACRIKARLDQGEEVGISAMNLLSALLSKLGATPVDETKVNHGDGEEEDAADKFFN